MKTTIQEHKTLNFNNGYIIDLDANVKLKYKDKYWYINVSKEAYNLIDKILTNYNNN